MSTDGNTDFAALGDEPFVSLTTFRRSGQPVATPVWLARDGGDLVVVTGADSGKVKRIRNDSRVTLQPCSRRGVVPEGAPTVHGTAEIVSDAARIAQGRRALRGKYGLQYRISMLVQKVFARRSTGVILRLSPS